MPPTPENYPVGIPLRPPPGWRSALPPPLPTPGPDPLMLILRAALVGLMVVVCMLVGWLVVQPKRPRAKEEPKVAVAQKVERPQATAPVVVKRSVEPTPVVPKREEPSREEPRPPTTPEVKAPVLTYQKHVLPILERACVSCHGARKRGGLDLRTLAALEKGGDTGPGVKPGKPDESPLWESIASGRMPPKKPRALSEAEKKTIRDWIAAGAEGRR